MLENGFIKLHRALLRWEWYHDSNTFRLFIHLLLTANYESAKWRGVVVERGQRITSYNSLAVELGLSVQNIRTSIKRLISTGEITHKATSKYGLVTVLNYDKYQSLTDKPTVSQQSANSRLTVGQQQRNKANIANNTNNEKEKIYIGRKFSEPVKQIIGEWLTYKGERKEQYKPTGLKSFLTQIENNLKTYSESQIISLITECMASGYRGLIWDKLKKEGAQNDKERGRGIAASDQNTFKGFKSAFDD